MGLLENKKLENKKLENNNIVIMNFTGAYEKQEFYGDLGAVWLDLREIYRALIVTATRRRRQPLRRESAQWGPSEFTSWIQEITIM